jgi:hypothetical protein
MFERDYLMRQLMQLFEVLQRIIRRRKQGENQLAREEVGTFYSMVKLENNLLNLTIEELMNLLVREKKFTNEQIELLAYVIKEQGELESQEENQINYFRKAWFLLDKVERESITFSMDRLLKLEELKGYLN